MKENKKKTSREKKVLIGALSLAAVTMASSTFAWFTSKDEVTNRLSANADYNVRIVESFAAPNNWLPGNVTNKDVYATNTGNIPAFVKEEVSGVLTITTEKATSTLTADSVKLTDEERYVMEAGAYLAYKPEGDTVNHLGDQIVIRPDDQADSTNPKTDFTPNVEGLYVFRRSIIVESDRTESFKYEGYYYSNGEYYKISNLHVSADSQDDLMDDGERTDGNLLSASAGFFEEKQEVVNPVSLEYVADGNKLVATYNTSIASLDSDLQQLANDYDVAVHNYEYWLEMVRAATDENSIADTTTKNAKDRFEKATIAFNKAKEAYEKGEQAKTDAIDALNQATTVKTNAQTAVNNKNIELYGDGGDSANPKPDSLAYILNNARDNVNKSGASQNDRERFENELKNKFSVDEISDLTVSQLQEFKNDLSSNDELHNYFITQTNFYIAQKKYDTALEQLNTLQTALNSSTTNYNTANTNKNNIMNKLYGYVDGSADTKNPDGTYKNNGKYTDDSLFGVYKSSELELIAATKALEEANEANFGKNDDGGTYYTLKDAIDNLEKARIEKQIAEYNYNSAMNSDAKDGNNTLKININLSDDVVTSTSEKDKWLLVTNPIEDNTAVFYYTGILLGSETSSKLIDSVELDQSVENDMYKSFDFDINVKLDSAQITYAEDNETILATAPNEQFDVKDELGTTIKDVTATLTDPKNLETAVTWTIS